jgi:hypothetical protein
VQLILARGVRVERDGEHKVMLPKKMDIMIAIMIMIRAIMAGIPKECKWML